MTPRAIPVVLDTNMLPRSRWKSKTLERLIEIAKAGIVELHASDVTTREWQTQREEELVVAGNKVQSLVKDLRNNPLVDGASADAIAQIESALDAFKGTFPLWNYPSWERWQTPDCYSYASDRLVRLVPLQILALDPSGADAVMNAYFRGSLPFKKIKSREDIPDAFILQAVDGLAEKLGRKVYFLSKDENQCKSAERYRGIAFASIKELFAAPEVRSRLAESDTHQKVLGNVSLVANLQRRIAAAVSFKLKGMNFSEAGLPSCATVAQVKEVLGIKNDVEVDAQGGTSLGDGWISVPFSTVVAVEIVFEMDFQEEHVTRYMIDSDVLHRVWRDDICELSGLTDLRVDGIYAAHFTADTRDGSYSHPADEGQVDQMRLQMLPGDADCFNYYPGEQRPDWLDIENPSEENGK
jgi:hypothetical protein